MKKIRNLVLFAVMVSLGSLFLISCGTSKDGGSPYSVLGALGVMEEGSEITLDSEITIVKNGKIDFSNIDMPITGEVVSTATVTLTNDTAGTSEVAPFSLADGSYVVPTTFPMNEGDMVSVRIEIDGDIITGNSTLIPNPDYSNLGPAGSYPLPYTASWEVSNTSFEASQTMFVIDEAYPGDEGYASLMPISQTSIQITSTQVSTGEYGMFVMGGNPMNLSGAASGSIIYTVGGSPDFNMVILY